jgi:hypothetical protein
MEALFKPLQIGDLTLPNLLRRRRSLTPHHAEWNGKLQRQVLPKGKALRTEVVRLR